MDTKSKEDEFLDDGIDGFCLVVRNFYPEEKDVIREKVEIFLKASAENKEDFVKFLTGGFNPGKNKKGEIVITSTREIFCCGSMACYQLIIGKEAMRIQPYGQEEE